MYIKTETRTIEKKVEVIEKTEEKRYILDLSEEETRALRGIYGRTLGTNLPSRLKFLESLYYREELAGAPYHDELGFTQVTFG